MLKLNENSSRAISPPAAVLIVNMFQWKNHTFLDILEYTHVQKDNLTMNQEMIELAGHSADCGIEAV